MSSTDDIAVSADKRLNCRMYESKYPEVEDIVMVKVKSIAEMGAYVTLLEYDNLEGMILLSELSRRRIRSINKLIRVGRQEVVQVLRVDKVKEYFDLSKRRVQPEDATKCEERYNKAKAVHSIMRQLAEMMGEDLEELNTFIAWPLYRKYGHALDAFKLALSEPEKVFPPPGTVHTVDEINDALQAYINSKSQQQQQQQQVDFTMVMEDNTSGSEAAAAASTRPRVFADDVMFKRTEIRDALLTIVQRKLKPQPIKVRADIEASCFSYEGIDAIKSALGEAENMGVPDVNAGAAGANSSGGAIRITLVAPPLYVMTTTHSDKNIGIQLLTDAIKAIETRLQEHGGQLTVKAAPRVVSARDDHSLSVLLEQLMEQNKEVDGDDYDEEDEDNGGY